MTMTRPTIALGRSTGPVASGRLQPKAVTASRGAAAAVRNAPAVSRQPFLPRTDRLTVRAAAAETEKETEELPRRLKWWEKDMQDNMVDIHSMEEFLAEMEKAGDKLVIVDYYAQWCHACKSLYPKLAKMMGQNEDIVLLKVDFDSNRSLVKSLGIKVLPFFHFYRGNEGRVAAFSASLRRIDRLKDAIAEHNTPRCQLGDPQKYDKISDINTNEEEEKK